MSGEALKSALSGLSPAALGRFVAEHVQAISQLAQEKTIEAHRLFVLGAALRPLRGAQALSTASLVRLAVLNDCLCATSAALIPDAHQQARLKVAYPTLWMAARFYAKLLSPYRSFEDLKPNHALRFLRAHQHDHGLFGGCNAKTRWLGLTICARLAALSEETAWARYERMIARLMDTLVTSAELSERSAQTRAALKAMLSERRAEPQPAPSAQPVWTQAFHFSEGPEVFSSITHASELARADPMDAPSLHAEGRALFETMLDHLRSTEPDHGRWLVVLGASGAGKTHLLRAFRTHLHQQQAGYGCYIQLSAPTERCTRMILHRTLDSLLLPYQESGERSRRSGLARLSDTLVERSSSISQEDLQRLRQGARSGAATQALIAQLTDNLMQSPQLEGIDIDVLRALLALQHPQPGLRARVLKWFRGEALEAEDRARLGGVTSKTYEGAPLFLLEQLGKLMWRLSRGALVFLLDQAEDAIASEPHRTRTLEVLRHLCEHIPSSILVFACETETFEQQQFGASLQARVMHRVFRLQETLDRAECEALIAARLQHLHASLGIRTPPPEPCYPLTPSQLQSIASQSPRAVLERCAALQRAEPREAPEPAPQLDFPDTTESADLGEALGAQIDQLLRAADDPQLPDLPDLPAPPAEASQTTPDEPSTDDLEDAREVTAPLPISPKLMLGEAEDGPSEMSANELLGNLSIVGGARCGKSTAAASLVEQVLAQGAAVVWIDRRGDLATNPAQPPDRAPIEIYTPGAAEGRPMTFSLLPALAAVKAEEQLDDTASALGALLELRDTQRDRARLELLQTAVSRAHSEGTWSLDAIIAQCEADEGLAAHLGALSDHPLISEPPSPGPLDTMTAPSLTVIATRFLRGNHQLEFLLIRLLIDLVRWTSAQPGSGLKALLVLEEADLWLPAYRKPTSQDALTRTMQGASALGIGTVLIPQSLGGMSFEHREMSKLWLLGRITQESTRTRLGSLLKLEPERLQALESLDSGEFYRMEEERWSLIRTIPGALEPKPVSEESLLSYAQDQTTKG